MNMRYKKQDAPSEVQTSIQQHEGTIGRIEDRQEEEKTEQGDHHTGRDQASR